MENNFYFLINQPLVQLFFTSLICLFIFDILLKNYRSAILISVGYSISLLSVVPNVQDLFFSDMNKTITILACLMITHIIVCKVNESKDEKDAYAENHIFINYIIYILIYAFIM